MKRIGVIAGILLLLAALFGWWLTAPNRLSAETLAALPEGDAAAGETVFWAGGCASCHAKDDASGEALKVMSGGHALKTPFGTFIAPNISSDPVAGIGAWSAADFANAMLRGVAPDGAHYYPAFPYTSYARMTPKDVADLWAYMKTLPASENVAASHELSFPFNIRRGLGLWKLLYLDDAPIIETAGAESAVERGRYLVEGPSHCGACHTPRDSLGGSDKSRWLAGGPAPEGKGSIPNITPSSEGIGAWSASDIAYSLKSGFTPEFDSFGGSMADVVKNTQRLTDADREAIAAYLKTIPAHP